MLDLQVKVINNRRVEVNGTLREEAITDRNFRVFLFFWSFLQKFRPLEILNQQNAKVF